MGIGHGGHCVGLEILVGPKNGYSFHGTPVGERGLSIVEPFIAHIFHVVVVQVGHSLSNFTSWHSSTEIVHLIADFSGQGIGVGALQQQMVIEAISAPHHLNFIEIMALNCRQ